MNYRIWSNMWNEFSYGNFNFQKHIFTTPPSMPLISRSFLLMTFSLCFYIGRLYFQWVFMLTLISMISLLMSLILKSLLSIILLLISFLSTSLMDLLRLRYTTTVSHNNNNYHRTLLSEKYFEPKMGRSLSLFEQDLTRLGHCQLCSSNYAIAKLARLRWSQPQKSFEESWNKFAVLCVRLFWAKNLLCSYLSAPK